MLRDIEVFIEELVDKHGVLRVVTLPLAVAGILSGLGIATSSGAALVVLQLCAVAIVVVVMTVLAVRSKESRAVAHKHRLTAIRFAKRITDVGLDYTIVDWNEIEAISNDEISVVRRVHIRATAPAQGKSPNPVVLCWQRQLGPEWRDNLTDKERRSVQISVSSGHKNQDGSYQEGARLPHVVDWQGVDALVYVDLQENLSPAAERVLFFRTTWPGFTDPIVTCSDSYHREWRWKRQVDQFEFQLRIAGDTAAAAADLGISVTGDMPNPVLAKDGKHRTVTLKKANPSGKHELSISPPHK